jgi:hypothetical protein
MCKTVFHLTARRCTVTLYGDDTKDNIKRLGEIYGSNPLFKIVSSTDLDIVK